MPQGRVHDMVAETYAYRQTDNFSYRRLGKAADKKDVGRTDRRHDMDFKTLKYFITVVESGTISAAAKKLYMSQPPLSNQMYNLEEELGCTLFERTSRHIILTGAGKLLYDRAKILLNSLDAVKEEVSDFNKKHAGVIRIGMISSVAEAPLSAKIAAYAKANPSVILDIYECNTYQMIEMLHAKTLHLGIARTPFTANKFKQEPILDGHVVAVGKKEFFDDSKDSVSLAEIAEKPLILYRRWESTIAGFLDQMHLPFNIVCRNDDARTTLFYAEQGLGIALLPISAAFTRHPDIISKEIEGDPWKTDIILLYDESSYLPSCAKELLEFLRNTDETELLG